MSSDAHVLVLDDDEGILLLAARALRRVGYRVSACSTVQQALDCIGEPLPDLLVLDYRLGTPQTGLDFFRGLVARGIKLPAILATGFSDESRIIEALRAGVSDVVPKAADYLDYLPEAVERALNEARMRRVVAESERMRDRERHYRTIAEALPHLVWTCTPSGECDFLSRQWSDYTGMPAGAGLGAGWFDAVHVDDLPALRDAWRQTIGRGVDSFFVLDVRLRRHDGAYRWFCVRGTALHEADGRIVKWFGTCTDIQDQREASDERERLLQSEQAARQAAEEANRAKDRFLAMLSHELRTPLTPVLASARMLERARDVPDPVRSAMKVIRRNIELEARLIDDLLDLTRVANGKLLLALETVDVHELIDAVLEIFRSDIQVKQLRVELDCAAQHRFVRGDRARLQQMLWNLIKNAAKFTPEHGRIVLRTRDADAPSEAGAPQIRIDVQDSGIGIAPEQLGRLFNAFEQGGRHTTQQYGGLGLGLAITKALTDVHGGTVHASSEGLGRGATFTIVLPSVEAPGPVMERGTIAAATQRATLDILLVEDHQDTADVMAQLIAGFGHNVVATGTVASALQAARQRRFDLVVSDIGLPDGTGLDLITALRGIETGARVPAVALTGYGSDDDVRRCLDAGFMSHLTKPVNFTLLEGLIEEIAMAKGSGDALPTPTA